MSYRGRPSRGCEACRARKVKCDETKPVCNRCSKSNHECKYRDQADLLFRNQTAFAAQRAEESWRKRSKSHQRGGSDSTTSDPSSISNRQSPQTNQQISPHGSSRPSPQKELSAEPPPSIPDFNTLPPGQEPKLDISRLAYERFVYDFIIFESPNKGPGDISDALWDFIPPLYQKAEDGSCLKTIVNAVSYANFSSRCKVPRAQVLAEECVGKGFNLLIKMLSDKKLAMSDEALCSVYLMGVYESLTSPTRSPSYLAHKEGANALLQLRTLEEFYSSPISGRLYEVSYAQMLIGNLQAGKPPALPVRNIVTARQYLPNFYSTSGIYVIQLIHNEASLHAKWHETKNSPQPPTSRWDLQVLLQTALDLDAEFQAWESTIPRSWRYQMEPNTLEARATYDIKWRNLILGSKGAPGEIHSYPTLRRCWIWMFYRTSRIFLLRDLIEILNWMFRFPEPNPADGPTNYVEPMNLPGMTHGKAATSALDNVSLNIHHAFATTHLVNTIEKSCSAVLGNFTVPIPGKSFEDVVGMRGYVSLWSLGNMDAVLKAGLIPDMAAPPSPPSSNSPASPSHPHIPPSTSISFSSFSTHPAPPPFAFRMPSQNMHHLYHKPLTAISDPTDFPELPPIPPPIPEASQLQFPPSPPAPTIVPSVDQPVPQKHVFDTSPHHPFDASTNLPTLDFNITKPARIDVTARREWIHRMLYYMASDLGIKKGIAVPGSEGTLEVCKAQVEQLLGR